MFYRSLIALGTAFTIIAAPAQALPPQSVELLTHLTDAGGRYYVDSAMCDKYPAFGFSVGGVVHICEEFHDGDVNELTDTVRHEVWHTIQACNRGPLMYDLDREVGEAVRRGWDPKSYPRHQLELEAEARNAAANYTEAEIASIFNAYCH